MPIANFQNKTTCRDLQREVVAALQAIAEKHGLTITPHGGTIEVGALDYICKLKFSINNDETRDAASAAAFNQFCGLYDLQPHHLGTDVMIKGERYTLIGLSERSMKFPFKMRKFSDKSVVQYSDALAARIREAHAAKGGKK